MDLRSIHDGDVKVKDLPGKISQYLPNLPGPKAQPKRVFLSCKLQHLPAATILLSCSSLRHCLWELQHLLAAHVPDPVHYIKAKSLRSQKSNGAFAVTCRKADGWERPCRPAQGAEPEVHEGGGARRGDRAGLAQVHAGVNGAVAILHDYPRRLPVLRAPERRFRDRRAAIP